MSRCRLCKKPIKWIEVPGPAGLPVWRAFDKRRRRAGREPYHPHECEKLKGPAIYGAPPADRPRPWWLDDDD